MKMGVAGGRQQGTVVGGMSCSELTFHFYFCGMRGFVLLTSASDHGLDSTGTHLPW